MDRAYYNLYCTIVCWLYLNSKPILPSEKRLKRWFFLDLQVALCSSSARWKCDEAGVSLTFPSRFPTRKVSGYMKVIGFGRGRAKNRIVPPSTSGKPTPTTGGKATMRKTSVRMIVCALLCMAAANVQRVHAATATYQYTGKSFTYFSCGPSADNTATMDCFNFPAPGNSNTSYTATDHVAATLAFDSPLVAGLNYQDVTGQAGFQLTMDDGHQTLISGTATAAGGVIAKVSTDANGHIIGPWLLVINEGNTADSGIASENEPPVQSFVQDSGVLACCDPTIHGDLAINQNLAGTWSGNTPPPPPPNLAGKNLKGANLQGQYLQGANIAGANLQGANLSGANLQGANLKGANLSGANLSGANLTGANLAGANLQNANLQNANFTNTNLSGANLQGARTGGAIFTGAITKGCNSCP
jgi:hypothetical protein